MRLVKKSLTRAILVAALAGPALIPGPAFAKARIHHATANVSVRVNVNVRAPVYPYAYVPDYAYYVPTRVFRCYPARLMVEDQVGLVVGYVPLGTCG